MRIPGITHESSHKTPELPKPYEVPLMTGYEGVVDASYAYLSELASQAIQASTPRTRVGATATEAMYTVRPQPVLPSESVSNQLGMNAMQQADQNV